MSARRPHVLIFDRFGYNRYSAPDGTPTIRDADVSVIVPVERVGEFTRSPLAPVLRCAVGTQVENEALVRDLVVGLHAAHPIDRIVAITERLLLPAARLRDRLGIAGMSEAQTLVIRDKVVMKERVRAAGLAVPDFVRIETAAEAAELLGRHGAIVLKPALAMGSLGVRPIRSPDELATCPSLQSLVAGPWEAEAFVEGALHHVDSVVEHGRVLAATASQYLDPTTNYRDYLPCRSVTLEPGPVTDRILAFNAAVVAALGDFSGVTHHELFLRPDGEPVLCEIAGRPGGTGVQPTFRHAFGVDLYEFAVKAQLDIPFEAPQRICDDAVGDTMIYAPPGRIRAVRTPLFGEDWVLDVITRKRPGDVLREPTMFGDAVAVVTVCGPDVRTVLERLDAIITSTVVEQEREACTVASP